MKENNNYIVINRIYLLISIIILIIAIGINIGLTLERFNNLEKRVCKLEEIREFNSQSIIKLEKSTDEIRINLKMLLEKYGIKYQTSN